ncbi:unnamed protein product [Rhizophagus irregularis]|uniref:Uncharacterized protein n=1 Tax=Rhizophagus irregularis TaxID=588596 RepID=A0A915YQP7_9GLOM|nr:unnamed protein product [Rhizophagus irregularis]CAB5315137.1 unnamed protein product [Rhizophagus irregularis]
MEFINEITIHLRIQRVKAPQQIIRYPLKRPDIRELARTFHGWREEYNKYYIKNEENQEELTRTELIEQIEEVEKINKSLLNNSSMTNKKHPGAIYKSIPFNFENLSEPKNSDDYYKSYENISSKKYSESVLKSDNSNDFESFRID